MVNQEIKISCFCSGITFPNGEATNNRIIFIGKALTLQKIQFKIYINAEGNRNELNSLIAGNVDGLYFRHLNGSMVLALPLWRRIYNYYGKGFYSTASIIKKLARDRENVVYLYSHGSLFNVWVSILAKFYKVRVVQEVNEWKDDINKRPLLAFIYKKIMFRWSTGVIVISDHILRKIQRHTRNKNIKLFLMPVLADKTDWNLQHYTVTKTFVWCGLVEGYLKDVLFMIDAFSKIHRQYPDYKLVICGKYKFKTAGKIEEYLKLNNIPVEKIKLTGFILNESLVQYCQSATALISPLWNDQASIARFPTKIASFLFSGRPILTCKIGEVGKYLQDKKTALFFTPSDSDDLASKMKEIIEDEKLAHDVGEEGRALAISKFDYRVYAIELYNFFSNLK